MTANGHLAPTQLVSVDGQHLSPATADAYRALCAAAERSGHSLAIFQPVGGYRSEAVQQDMHDNPGKYNLKPGVPLAPVGLSRHGQGRAVDIKGGSIAARAWCRANAHKFGFSRPMPDNDPDHYELGKNVATATDPTPAPPQSPKGDDMKYIYKEEGGVAWALLDSHLTAGYVQTTVVAEAENYRRVCPTPPVLVSAADFTASIAAAVWHKSLCPAGGSGSFTTADRARLQAVPTAAENAKAVVAEIAS